MTERMTKEQYLRELANRGNTVVPSGVSLQDVIALYDDIHGLEDECRIKDKHIEIAADMSLSVTEKKNLIISHLEKIVKDMNDDTLPRRDHYLDPESVLYFITVAFKSVNDMTPEEQRYWFANVPEIDPNA